MAGGKETMVFNLGKYVRTDEDADVVQTFSDGDDGRTARVRYICESEAKGDAIVSATENVKHAYEVVVHTQKLCGTGNKERSPKARMRAEMAKIAGRCAQKVMGWWTYEFCFKGKLRQFHRDSSSGSSSSEYSLGIYDDVLNSKNEMTELVQTGKDMDGNYYAELFTQGTPCDLGGGGKRKTEVRYYCTKTRTHSIHTVEETATCQYVMKVRTHLVCDYVNSLFKEKQEEVQIHCLPGNKDIKG